MSTPTSTSPISDRAVSYLRTVVPVLWGSAVAWLLTVVVLPAEVTDLLTSDLAITAVTALVVGAWYIAWRWAEPHIPDWLTRLVLGSAQTPIYARHAKVGTFEYAPPTSSTPPSVVDVSAPEEYEVPEVGTAKDEVAKAEHDLREYHLDDVETVYTTPRDPIHEADSIGEKLLEIEWRPTTPRT